MTFWFILDRSWPSRPNKPRGGGIKGVLFPIPVSAPSSRGASASGKGFSTEYPQRPRGRPRVAGPRFSMPPLCRHAATSVPSQAQTPPCCGRPVARGILSGGTQSAGAGRSSAQLCHNSCWSQGKDNLGRYKASSQCFGSTIFSMFSTLPRQWPLTHVGPVVMRPSTHRQSFVLCAPTG